MSGEIQSILKDPFRLKDFKKGQKEIITSVLNDKDVLAVMPTGGGKSLCYQLPAVQKKGLTVAVSPLIALMNDQVHALQALGIPSGCVHSGMNETEKKNLFNEIKESESFILYVSPERVQKPGFEPWIKAQNVNLIAIDEAHCVSQWGHDFRPEYSMLSKIRDWLPDVPMIALTATATPIVKKDICDQLNLDDPDEHVYGFYRPNLFYQVESCDTDHEKAVLVREGIKKTPKGRIIIYSGTRKAAEQWSHDLSDTDEKVAFYHAGLSSNERNEIERKFTDGEVRILAATNAFGMGIDHPDVRLVIHTKMPGNIESYYQEVGRAGRDGKDSTCLLTFSKKDKGLQSFFINKSDAPRRVKMQRWAALNSMVQYAEGSECRHADILTYFKDEDRIDKCGHCDACDPDSDRMIPRPEVMPQMRPKGQKKKKVMSLPLTDEQAVRYDHLREWRKEYAKENDIPAFVVFSDKALRDLVIKNPTTLTDLEQVYGFGPQKLEALGSIVLGKLREC